MTVARDEKQGRAGYAPPPWAPVPKGGRAGRAEKPQLSRGAIVEAAVRIIDAEGLDAVSMRRVAQEFGTGAASLYAYVANKDELYDLIVDWVLGEIADRWEHVEPTAANWRELTLDLIRLSRRVLVAHRDLARTFLGRIPFGPNGLRVIEDQLAIMRAGGVPDQVAAYAGDLFGQYLVSSAIEDDMWRSRYPGTDPDDAARELGEIGDYLRSLPTDRFPNIVDLSGVMINVEVDGRDRFELGLEILVRGIASFTEAVNEAKAGEAEADDAVGAAAKE